MAGVHHKWHIVIDIGMRDVHRHDQHRHAALRDGRLAGHDGLPPGLCGRQDHVAKDADAPVYPLEVDFLDEIEPQFVANDLGGDQDDWRAIAVRLDDAVDEMQAAGTAVSRPVIKASPWAAKAPASSWRILTHSMSLSEMWWAIRLSVSPTTP